MECECVFKLRSDRLHCKTQFWSPLSVRFFLGGGGGGISPTFRGKKFGNPYFQEILKAGWEPSAVQMFSAGGRNKRGAATFI